MHVCVTVCVSERMHACGCVLLCVCVNALRRVCVCVVVCGTVREYMHVCSGFTCMCVSVYRLEVDVQCFPGLLSTLYVEAESLI